MNEVTIDYLLLLIEQIKNDTSITVEKRDSLIFSYKQHLELYRNIKEKID